MNLAAIAVVFSAAAPLAASPLPAGLILMLCALAGVGTVLLLPSAREAALRKIGGTIVFLAGLIGMALLLRAAAGARGVRSRGWGFTSGFFRPSPLPRRCGW